MYSDEFIEDLIACPKNIIDGPRQVRQTRADFVKINFSLKSVDDQYDFNGFITHSNLFPENFSVGLVYNPKVEKGTIILLRCNGMHGGTKEFPHHASCHIHRPSADDLNNGNKQERHIEVTKEYSTLETAVQFFIKRIGILPSDRQKHFAPPSGQIDMFGRIEEI